MLEKQEKTRAMHDFNPSSDTPNPPNQSPTFKFGRQNGWIRDKRQIRLGGGCL